VCYAIKYKEGPEPSKSSWSAPPVSGVSVADVKGKELVIGNENWHTAAIFYTVRLRIHVQEM
jgi:hypothetical protein